MKYYSRLNVYKASNVSFNPDTIQAYSYGWWRFVDCINGVVVFNDYGYSNSTRKHQYKVRRVMDELGIKVDVRVKTSTSLNGSKEVLKLAAENAYLEYFEASLKSSRARVSTWNNYRIEESMKSLRQLDTKLKVKVSKKRIAELKKEAIKADESDRRRKRERAKLAKEKKQKRDTLIESLTEQGFSPWIDYRGEARLKCDQCVACTVNGFAIHEQGCPNMKRKLQLVDGAL